MVHLDINDTSKSLAVVGGYIVIVGLVSYFLKERLFMCTWLHLHSDVQLLTLQPRRSLPSFAVSLSVPLLPTSSLH